MNTKTTLGIAALTLCLLTACGGDTYVKVQGTTNISKGQELTDLQRALNDGAISKQEYDSLYRKIVARPN